ncbi:MAG: protein-L-isoaspartate(D-aspartate) O-methyltransferase, partial [Methylococcales bacterium]
RETGQYLDREVLSDAVLQALRKVPRHRFVPEDQVDRAYENCPLPIGYGQTISQPFIVAIMTDLLNLQPNHRVLEIGTGSAYQAAILSEIVSQVYTVEIVEELAGSARERLKNLGYERIHVRQGDGYFGWESEAPFDAIVVTAAGSHIPPPLVQQLKAGGRMMIPVGSRSTIQQLVLVHKDLEGLVTSRQILPVRFVPLTGDHP